MTTKTGKLNIPALLQRVPLFQGLDGNEIASIAADASELDVPRGAVLFRQGEPCLGVHLLLYGQIKLFVSSPQGQEKVVEIISPGQTFGEALMFMDKPYVVTAQALADSQLLHLAKGSIDAALAATPGLARKMIASLSQRLHKLIADVEAYSLQSGRERIVGYLLRDLADGEDDQQIITLPTSKGTIASRLNLTQEHFSRILHELTEAGLIRVDGRHIHILDLPRLRGDQA